MEKYKETKRDLHIVFIDLEKAYNKVMREVCYRCLEARGVPVVCISVVKDMYDGVKTHVRMVGEHSEHYPVEMGLYQGSTLSVFLFALLMNELMRYIQDKVLW